jgi:hypothetical protein
LELLPWFRHHVAELAERVRLRRNDESARNAARRLASAAPIMSDGQLARQLQRRSNIPARWSNEALAAVTGRRG